MEIEAWSGENARIKPPAAYSGMPNRVYHAQTDWLNHSRLLPALRSYEAFEAQTNEETLALNVGQAFHIACQAYVESYSKQIDCLRMYDENVETFPNKTLSKAFWNKRVEHPNKAVVPEEQYDAIQQWGENIASAIRYAGLLSPDGLCELSLFWEVELTRHEHSAATYSAYNFTSQYKSRADYISFHKVEGETRARIIEFKSTKSEPYTRRSYNSDPEGAGQLVPGHKFANEIFSRRYDMQAAMQVEAVEAVCDCTVGEYYYAVVAKSPPYEARILPLRLETIGEGREWLEHAKKIVMQKTRQTKPLNPVYPRFE